MLPATIQGIRRYLGSGLIKGIGPKMAERIVDHFGPTNLKVIEQAPGRLVEVPGLGPKRTAMITAAWAEQQAIKEVMVFLQGMGVSTSLNLEGAAVAHKRPSGVKPRRSLPQAAGRSRLVPPQSLGAPPGC